MKVRNPGRTGNPQGLNVAASPPNEGYQRQTKGSKLVGLQKLVPEVQQRQNAAHRQGQEKRARHHGP